MLRAPPGNKQVRLALVFVLLGVFSPMISRLALVPGVHRVWHSSRVAFVLPGIHLA
jgi:hypothetical protein